MKKTKATSAEANTKTIPAKPTDVKTAGLSGPVKQVMHTTYKAHQKPGTVIQGKIESAYTSSRNNFITTFNEKGAKILEQLFGTDGSYNNTLNHLGQPTESIHYNKAGALQQKTTSTYTDQGGMIEHIVRNADGT
ncbi:MAG TPA: hypothetical protein VI757_11195, partial [Bacteroidia bacterium]|nr:hypothetical protein [Bacteroidia bacterium]